MEELNYHYKYPHPSVTTDCVIFGYDGRDMKVLLVKRGREPYKGKWAFPGGFLNMDESADVGALRELCEETGLRAANVTQFHTFTAPGRDPRERVISVAYYAFVRLQEVKGGDDAAEASWYRLDDIPPLAFDHEQMFDIAVKSVREKALVDIIGSELLDDKFYADDLHRIYEAVLGTAVDKEIFVKWIVNTGRVLPLTENAGWYEFNPAWDVKALDVIKP